MKLINLERGEYITVGNDSYRIETDFKDRAFIIKDNKRCYLEMGEIQHDYVGYACRLDPESQSEMLVHQFKKLPDMVSQLVSWYKLEHESVEVLDSTIVCSVIPAAEHNMCLSIKFVCVLDEEQTQTENSIHTQLENLNKELLKEKKKNKELNKRLKKIESWISMVENADDDA